MQETTTEYPLTQYSHGAGCGCKISPKVLDSILNTGGVKQDFPGLLVGNDERDDAAVLDMGDGTAVISTTDFFMPIVDDPAAFGRIASVNAISDVYAMGGSPVLAIAILGWPIDKIPAEVAAQVIEGAREACREANIPLAGGHSIDAPEPIFGLAVTGRVNISDLKKNNGAKPGGRLFLTKPLGVGILSTAQKKGLISPEHHAIALDNMMALNKVGETFGKLPYVQAMTDVTGFGLLGHLSEVCAGSCVSARVRFSEIPLLDKAILDHYIEEKCLPGGTFRNWDSYGHCIAPLTDEQKFLLCDPQTSGGLLVIVDPEKEEAFRKLALESGMDLKAFGEIVRKEEYLVFVD